MAVMTLGTSQYDKLFLEYILKGINIELYQNTTVYDRFKNKVDTVYGKYVIQKLLTATPKSARPSSSSSFPTALQGTYDEFVTYMKRGMYASLQFDGLLLACGKGEGAVKDVLAAETEGIMFYMANRLNKQYWGDGSGRLAQLDALSSNSTSVTINNPWFGLDSNEYTVAHQYLEEGMPVDIYDTSGNLEAEEVVISSIADDADGTSTLTMASAVTASDDSWIFQHDTYAASEAAGTGVPMGLAGIISTSNATIGITSTSAFQNINRSNYPYAQAQTWAHGSVAITNQAILKAVQKCERYGNISVIIMNDVIWRAYYTILEADKTMPNTPAYWGGVSGITFWGGRNKQIPVIYDEDCPDQTIYLIDDSRIFIHSPNKSGLDWLPGDSGHVLTRVQGKDEYTANLISYYNMTTNMPKALGYITGVKHAES